MRKRIVTAVTILLLAVVAVIAYVQWQITNGNNQVVISSPPEQTNIVVYDGRKFRPAIITVKSGSTVYFSNASQLEAPMYVASDAHPQHADYPGFDTGTVTGKRPAKGSSFSFTFDNAGTWGYHDHNNPSAKGIIIVE